MQRRCVLFLLAVAALVLVAAIAWQNKPGLLLLEWAGKSGDATPIWAILLEFGLADKEPKDWSGQAQIAGARVVRREGYRFRDQDRLIEPDGWSARSKLPVRAPTGKAAAKGLDPLATVGVVLHLAEVKPEATLTLKTAAGQPTQIPLAKVLAGETVPCEGGSAVVRLVSTTSMLAAGPTEDDFPAAAYGPDGTLWVAYISYTLKDPGRCIEAAQLKEQPKSFQDYYKPEFGDQLFVQYYRAGRWSKPAPVTEAKEDLVRCAVAVERSGLVYVAYSAQRNGNFDIYLRTMDLNTPEAASHPKPRMDPEVRVSENPAPDLGPVMCTDQNGQCWLAWQAWGERGESSIAFCNLEKGKVEDRGRLISGGANQWHPAIAASGDGKVAIAFDAYNGDYDVAVAVVDGPRIQFHKVASSAKFEARPSIAYDSAGRLWIAYEEGPENWGKDFGALDADEGHPLYSSRSVRVICLDGGKLLKPAAELPTAEVTLPKTPYTGDGPRYERATRYSGPRLGLDGKGRLWLAYREKYGSRYSSHPGSYWLTWVRRLDGDRWTPPVEVHRSDGLLDHRPVLLPHASGGLLMVHNTDGRYTTPDQIDNQIGVSTIHLPGAEPPPKLVAHDAGTKSLDRHNRESASVARIRGHRVTAEGKTYLLLRGEFHRHTEVSWDGGADGSLEDMFRYAIDAAQMDWIGNGDHDNGAGREYPWWLTQKLTDAYFVRNVFTPMFTYERSVPYPHGHRNCMFARRGVMTLPRLAEPNPKLRVAGIHADDTKMLYRYLKELDGICAVHTSATGMGTDWRDNDPAVEPIVEIYQGDRMSYEMQGAPRAGYSPESKREPVNIGGWYPDGFIDNAFKKGYRLGFQASSDHWSTHISYCIVLAEKRDRTAILEALKKRRCYGATDDIVLDVRSGARLMGEEFRSLQAPTLQIHVDGTAVIDYVEVLRDSQVVATFQPKLETFRVEWKDPRPLEGVHYYYVRVTQRDGELAWSSPMWIHYGN